MTFFLCHHSIIPFSFSKGYRIVELKITKEHIRKETQTISRRASMKLARMNTMELLLVDKIFLLESINWSLLLWIKNTLRIKVRWIHYWRDHANTLSQDFLSPIPEASLHPNQMKEHVDIINVHFTINHEELALDYEIINIPHSDLIWIISSDTLDQFYFKK